jgi:hypothetical protein
MHGPYIFISKWLVLAYLARMTSMNIVLKRCYREIQEITHTHTQEEDGNKNQYYFIVGDSVSAQFLGA